MVYLRLDTLLPMYLKQYPQQYISHLAVLLNNGSIIVKDIAQEFNF